MCHMKISDSRGMQDCPYYVRAELLGDKLARNLPDFKIHKIVKTTAEWPEWLCEICEANGWKHEQSPIIWRELVDRGGKGVLIGGSNEFEEYAYGYYGVTIDLDGKSMKVIAYENQSTKIELDEEERERIRNEKFIKVCITNASSPVCFSLVDSLLSGKIFGEEKISLCLLDCDPAQTAELQYIAENIQNMAYGLLYLNVFVTSDCEKAFKGSRIIIFLDEVERKEEEKVHRWTERNAVLFGFYGTTLLKVAKSDTLLLVAGNNYMCLNMSILNEIVSHISSRNIIGVSKVIENQAKSVLAEKLPASSCSIDNVVILGSISNDYLIELDKTLVREFDCAVVGPATFSQPLNDIFHQQSWLKKEYVNEVSSRKHVNEMNLRHPTYHLIGHAITTTLNYWWNGLSSNAIFSATLISDGWYGVPEGIAFSFPVAFYLPLAYSVIENLSISEKCREDMDLIIENLVKDRALFVVKDGKLISKVVSVESLPESEDTDYSAFMSSRTPSSQRSDVLSFLLEEMVEEQEALERRRTKMSASSMPRGSLDSEHDLELENLDAIMPEEEVEEEISETALNTEDIEIEDNNNNPPAEETEQ
ncbi:putative malate dehydrogenase 1B [Octopus vulgaris]|uniref:Malate dehydrogenase 1B n=1 Tax=Octopus vulgaris TaxID=6645 RepID=A0AA36BJM7_OCTVU|nr:putative malate dehydrogenase 1B [Octopus vulgaris]